VSVYIDANVLLALFVPDALNERAEALVKGLSEGAVLSDLATLEVSSTIGRLVRTGELTRREATAALSNFDSWTQAQSRLETQPADVAAATGYVRRSDVNLQSSDALHIAIAARGGAKLLTLDTKMRANAKKAGLPVI